MKGKVVLVKFPFDDLSSSKVRPAVCLTNAVGANQHIILALLTNLYNAFTLLLKLTAIALIKIMSQLKIDYPETLPDALQQTREQFEQEAKMAMAVKLFEMKRISSGLAAQLAGIDRVTFLLNLHRYGVAMIDLTEEELISDLANA
jgi:predicted HTH domain antitoxin